MGNKQIAKNTFFLYVRMGFSLIVSLFTVRIILKAMGEMDYGIFNVVSGFVSMLGFLNVSLVNGVQRFYNYELGKTGILGLCNVYKSALRIQLILSLIIVLAIETIGIWYLNSKMIIPSGKIVEANWLMQLSLASLLFTLMQVPYTAAIISQERFNAYAYIGIFDVILKLFIAYIIYIVPSEKLIVYGLLLLSVSIIDFIIYYVYCRRKIDKMFKEGKFDWDLTKSMVKFMSWNTLGSGAYIFRTQGLNLLLNHFFGVILNAANGIATQVSGAVQNFALNLILAFKPQMVQEYASGHNDRSINLMILMTKTSFTLIYIISVPIILDIDYILNLWLGYVPECTSSLTCLVLVSICISCWHTPIVQMIHTIGVMGKFQIVTTILLLLTIVISWIAFLAGASPNWAYYATIIVYLVNQIAAVIILRGITPFSIWNYVKTAIIPCLIFASFMPALPYIYSKFFLPSIGQLVILSTISIIVAIPLTYFIILSKKERQQIVYYIKQKTT